MAEKECIEREAFIESQQHLYCDNCARRKDSKGKFVYDIGDAPCRACGIMDVLDAIEDFPAADVVDRKRGEWIDMGDFEQCSVCTGTRLKEMQTVYGKALWVKTPFCPNCGADMRQIMEYPQVPGITPTVI